MAVSESSASSKSAPSATSRPARPSPAEAARAGATRAPSAPRPTRRPALTVEAIVAGAIEVLDEAGVAGLSMRRVADQLGTGAASLYAHVSGKDELLELVFSELVGQ